MTICTFATPDGRRTGTALGAADWIGLAAAPTFAVLALATSLFGVPDMLCSTMQGGGPFGGMAFMYALMSVFHTAPWLRLIARWRSGI